MAIILWTAYQTWVLGIPPESQPEVPDLPAAMWLEGWLTLMDNESSDYFYVNLNQPVPIEIRERINFGERYANVRSHLESQQ